MTYLLLILAVLLSFGFVYFFKPKKQEALRLLLAFSGSFLLALTLFELFPTVYGTVDPRTIGVFIMLGILLQVFLEFFSKGAEHGHVHIHPEKNSFPWLLLISLSVHAFIEGFPITGHGSIIYGILVHKIPIALILSIFLLNAQLKFHHALLFIFIFALMTPLGSLMSTNLDFIKDYYTLITAVVIGVFLHISTVILFESSEGHRFTLRKLVVIILGVLIAYLL
ncbi:MAG: ZIP family metal transporter [Flavobacteriaceae bacterium]